MPVLKQVAEAEAAKAAAALAEKEPELFTGIFVQRAKVGRAKCPVCHQQNEAGEWRVGVEEYAGGRFVVRWVHPKCWLTEGVAFSRNTSGRGSCKATKVPFEKGQLRLGYRSGKCDTWGHLSMKGLGQTLPSAMMACPDFKVEQVAGWPDLSSDEQAQVRGLVEAGIAGAEERERSKEEARDAGKKAFAKAKAGRDALEGALGELEGEAEEEERVEGKAKKAKKAKAQ